MNQLDLFSAPVETTQKIKIPKDLKSPLETSKGVKTKDFALIRKRWTEYVRSVQRSQGCSWNDARQMVLDYRGSEEAI